jgi:hypothetical protein
MKFFKYGVDVCNAMYDQYGGHSQWLANLLNVDYLVIAILDDTILENYCEAIQLDFKSEKYFKRISTYYDGFHHHINFFFFYVAWGGEPFNEGTE